MSGVIACVKSCGGLTQIFDTPVTACAVAKRSFAEAKGIAPLGRLAGFGVAGVEPGLFGLGPVPAVRKALAHAGWSLGDIERIEINEAFAAVPIAVARELGLPEDIVNVEGGAVAHGHPIGATGAILVTRLLHAMRRDGLRRGMSPCASGVDRALPSPSKRCEARHVPRPDRSGRCRAKRGARTPSRRRQNPPAGGSAHRAHYARAGLGRADRDLLRGQARLGGARGHGAGLSGRHVDDDAVGRRAGRQHFLRRGAALGAGRQAAADALVLHAIAVSLAFGFAFAALFLLFGRQIYGAMGGSGPELEAALIYSKSSSSARR